MPRPGSYRNTLALCLIVAALPATAVAEAPSPRVAIGLNVMQPAIYGIASAFFEDSHFVPIPIEGHFRIRGRWGIAGTLQYLHHKDGNLSLNGLHLALGPRFTIFGDGLRGLYVAFKVGLGFRYGDDYFASSYYRVGLLLQPEVGWAFAWGRPGFYLAVGLGLQSEVTLTEKEHSRWEWNGLGALINYYLPLVNVTVGFDI